MATGDTGRETRGGTEPHPRSELAVTGADGASSRESQDVERAREGDARAFERLYRTHVSRIHTLARRMAGAQAADDLTQEVFVRAWRKLSSFRGDSGFGTWLYRLALNLILSRRKALRKREDRFRTGAGILDGFHTRAPTAGLAIDLEAAVEALPEGAREVFVLFDVEGYSHAEIGEMLDISSGTSKSQLHRARSLLRDRLG